MYSLVTLSETKGLASKTGDIFTLPRKGDRELPL
jgi:hypothetical protein